MISLEKSAGYKIICDWLSSKNFQPFLFQKKTWQHIINGEIGLVNAPTGCGKTFSVFLGAIIDFINQHPGYSTGTIKLKKNYGLQLIWITPLRALGKDIGRAMEEVIEELHIPWKVGIRNGDTSTTERAQQKKQMPEVLIITPESLHLLLAQKGYADLFSTLKIIAVDEWHELLGSKRGVQVELAISRIVGSRNSEVRSRGSEVRSQEMNVYTDSVTDNSKLKNQNSGLCIWGISATIGNLEEAKEILLSPLSLRRGVGGEVKCEPVSIIPGAGEPARRQEGDAEVSSATIGNLEEVNEILLTPLSLRRGVGGEVGYEPVPNISKAEEPARRQEDDGIKGEVIKSNLQKQIKVESIFPDEIEKYPWAGHLGIKLAHKLIPIIQQSATTLIFINTRGMSETWYQALLNICPELAGSIALHHGSIDRELRSWIEDNLHTGKLKAVVCTASLDLGVDFRPVETVIQVGSPKGVARFLQRAGRSGHRPDAVSKIYFLPTHSLELMEAAALKSAMKENLIESREPKLLCYDVLIQFLNTLAISDGFIPAELFEEIKSTYCYRDLTTGEWEQILYFITQGGTALQQYDDYKKIEIEEGLYKINSRKVSMRHRLHIGTIVSDAMMKVKMMTGGYVGVIEEYFISRLEPGDVFTLAGRNLEFVLIKDMTALVRKSNARKSIVPSWSGGRMPLSANLGKKLREMLELTEVRSRKSAIRSREPDEEELDVLRPLFDLQRQLSHVPKKNELLVEQIETKDGFHLFVYPFEGRLVHEAMAAILAYRISRIRPISFSFAMNDYGFELLSDQPIPVDDTNVYELFSPANLLADIQRSINSTEMARRKFRDIAVIGGLIFQGMPGEKKKARHLQSSASLLFNVFSEYDPKNLLLRQAYQEVLEQQMEEGRLRDMLERIQQSNIIITFPEQLTPFCFPVKVDSMREDLSSEKLEDRVKKMQVELEME